MAGPADHGESGSEPLKKPGSDFAGWFERRGPQDRLCRLGRGEEIHHNRNVGRAIERQPASVASGEVGLVGEDRPGVFRSAAAFQGGGQLNFQMHEQRAGRAEQQLAGLGPLDGSAAQRENQPVVRREAGDGCMFAVAEGCFAVARKELGDGAAGLGFDDVIHIDKAPTELRRDERANGGFARAHEAGEDDAAWGRPVGAGRIGFGGHLTQYKFQARTMTMAPMVIKAPPKMAAVLTFSPSSSQAKIMTSGTESLSRGATREAGPSCRARK